MGTSLNLVRVASKPFLNSSKFFCAKICGGFEKLCCNVQNKGYSSSSLSDFDISELAALLVACVEAFSFGGVISMLIVEFEVSLLGSAFAAGATSKVVTLSVWNSPLALTELRAPRGKLWKRKMKTRPQKTDSSARDSLRSNSLKARRMTISFVFAKFF